MREFINGLICNLDAEKSFENSVNNYHVKGLRYINLLRTPDLTVKAYVCLPNKIKLNSLGLLVNPHTHLYNFTSYVLKGDIQNVVYRRTNKDTCYNTKFNMYHKEGNNFIYHPKTVYMNLSRHDYCRGKSYSLRACEIHSITFDPTQLNILIVCQYKTLYESNFYFSPIKRKPSLEGLYTKFTRPKYEETLNYLKGYV